MKNGNKLTSKDCVELEVVLRRFDALALASGSFEPARAEPTVVRLAAICKDQAAVGEAETSVGAISRGHI